MLAIVIVHPVSLFHEAQKPKITISKYGIILDRLECDKHGQTM